jgi:hypothetical protein
MRLMVLQHASSEKAEPGMRDFDRALNERGRKDAAKIGAYMAHHALLPDQVMVSPARHARETFEPVSEAYGQSMTAAFTKAALMPSSPLSERTIRPSAAFSLSATIRACMKSVPKIYHWARSGRIRGSAASRWRGRKVRRGLALTAAASAITAGGGRAWV